MKALLFVFFALTGVAFAQDHLVLAKWQQAITLYENGKVDDATFEKWRTEAVSMARTEHGRNSILEYPNKAQRAAFEAAESERLAAQKKAEENAKLVALEKQNALLRQQLAAQQATQPASTATLDDINDQLLWLRIQQAYPDNPKMWEYLRRNPRYISYYLREK